MTKQKRIFVSYRRDDDGAYLVPELNRKLTSRYGTDSVFYDIDNIPLGVDFREHLSTAISSASIVLVVIGDRWAGYDAQTGLRRIDREDDFVRIEVEAALNRAIPVVPVLVGKATMPCEKELPASIAELAYRNAAEVRTGKDYELHMAELLRGLDAIMGAADKSVVSPPAEDEVVSPVITHPPATQSDPTSSGQLLQDFWTQLVQHLAIHAPRIRPMKPSAKNYLNTQLSRKGFGLRATATVRSQRLGVDLYIELPEAKQHFAQLLAQKAEIESKLGFDLDWQEMPGVMSVRIATYYSDAPLDDKGRWPEYLNWLADRMLKMESVFGPLVQLLP